MRILRSAHRTTVANRPFQPEYRQALKITPRRVARTSHHQAIITTSPLRSSPTLTYLPIHFAINTWDSSGCPSGLKKRVGGAPFDQCDRLREVERRKISHVGLPC
jgi:hypothetical protein